MSCCSRYPYCFCPKTFSPLELWPDEVLAEASAVYGVSPDPVPVDAEQTQQEEFGEYAVRHLAIYGYRVVKATDLARIEGALQAARQGITEKGHYKARIVGEIDAALKVVEASAPDLPEALAP